MNRSVSLQSCEVTCVFVSANSWLNSRLEGCEHCCVVNINTQKHSSALLTIKMFLFQNCTQLLEGESAHPQGNKRWVWNSNETVKSGSDLLFIDCIIKERELVEEV